MALSSARHCLCNIYNFRNSLKVQYFIRKYSSITQGLQSTNSVNRNRNEIYTKYLFGHITSTDLGVNKPKQFSSNPKDESELSKTPKRSLPQLMEFPEIVWPSVLNTIKNWILINFIIRPYFDRDFSLPEFVTGAKQALQLVSGKLAEGELSSLPGLVAAETVTEIKNVVSKMSMAQRTELRVIKDDIYFSFPYQVGIMFDESNEKIQKRWVEITMVFHVLRGLKEMRDKGTSPSINMGMLPENRDKISICNYRFIKEFTQGNESDWTINVISHFKPADFIDE